MEAPFDVIVIGAGHAGLSISKLLQDAGLRHLVLERGRIGETWRTQRWDAFRLNSSNKFNLLPGQVPFFEDGEAFCSAPEFVASLEDYAKTFALPVLENANVTAIEKTDDQQLFSITALMQGGEKTFSSRQVVVASGGQNCIQVPAFSKNIAATILQLHASEFKNAARLPMGNVLVIGSAQSGIQIAEYLADEGHKVFLSTCNVGRFPRRYRGKDIFDWLFEMGFYDTLHDEISDPQVFKTRAPQVSGAGDRGRTTSLQSLARKGVVILGRAKEVLGDILLLEPNAAAHVTFADAFSENIKTMIDDFITQSNSVVAAREVDVDDVPDSEAVCASSITALSFTENNISSIIWGTGFGCDFHFLKLPVLHEDGTAKQHNGITEIEGLYFLGLPWLRKRKSGIIWGIADDAAFIAERVFDRHRWLIQNGIYND